MFGRITIASLIIMVWSTPAFSQDVNKDAEQREQAKALGAMNGEHMRDTVLQNFATETEDVQWSQGYEDTLEEAIGSSPDVNLLFLECGRTLCKIQLQAIDSKTATRSLDSAIVQPETVGAQMLVHRIEEGLDFVVYEAYITRPGYVLPFD